MIGEATSFVRLSDLAAFMIAPMLRALDAT